jgi:hypothetical protein
MHITAFIIFISVYFSPFMKLESFDRVVIWGHKLHSHTHSYIHNAFYHAFKALGYPTYWFDDKDDVRDFDFSNSLFLTEGQVDRCIPLRDDCQYMIHNISSDKYRSLKQKNWLVFQVYTDDVLSRPNLIKVAPCIYYDLPAKCLYMPWATDLLPDEIDQIKKNIDGFSVQNKIWWVGTIGGGTFGNKEQLAPFIYACIENGIDFVQKTNVASADAIKLIQESCMAPAIVGKWQLEKGYIPCRIFKNISYGKLGLTNSPRVYELFEGKVIYNQDTYQLFYEAKKKMETITPEEICDLMDFVKANHTYVNRVHLLLDFLKLVKTTYEEKVS